MTRATACPKCGAAVRSDADWCGQCYADLRPVPPAVETPVAPPTAVPSTASYGEPARDPLTSPLLDLLPPAAGVAAEQPTAVAASVGARPGSWPCTRCETLNEMEASVCTACGCSFLAAVRDENKPLLVLPVIGDVGALSRVQRILLALAAVLLLLLPLAALTILTTGSPVQQGPGQRDGTVTPDVQPPPTDVPPTVAPGAGAPTTGTS